MEVLLRVIGAPPLKIQDIDALIGEEIKRVQSAITTTDQREWHRQSRNLLDQAQTIAMSAYEGAKMRSPHRHRALADALELWHGWKAVHVAIVGRVFSSVRSFPPATAT